MSLRTEGVQDHDTKHTGYQVLVISSAPFTIVTEYPTGLEPFGGGASWLGLPQLVNDHYIAYYAFYFFSLVVVTAVSQYPNRDVNQLLEARFFTLTFERLEKTGIKETEVFFK